MKPLKYFNSANKSKSILTRNIVILSLALTQITNANFVSNSVINNQKSTNDQTQVQNIATQKYTVNIGETAESIAKRFNISIELLQSLNSTAPYQKQLSELQTGDVVLVPLTALPKDIAVASAKVLTTEEINQQTKIANLASQIGSSLNSDTNTANTASSLA